MKKTLIIFAFIAQLIYAQSLPYNFKFEKNKMVNKVSAETPRSNTIEDILIDSNGTVWLGTSRGLSMSEDGGTNWTNYYETEEFGIEKVSKVGYKDGVIWAGTWHFVEIFDQAQVEGSGLRYSTDNGATWEVIEQPVDAPDDSVITYGINEIKALPITVAVNNMPYDIDLTSNTIWMAAFAGGLRKSTDMGQSWQRVVLPPDYLDEINPNDTLSFDLSPSGGSLGFEENLNHRVFSIEAVTDSLIYVGTANGINKSTDGGVSWRKFNHQNQNEPISGNFIVDIDYDYSTNTVWAATWKAEDLDEFWGVSSSSDGGETWQTHLPNSRTHSFGFKELGVGIESHVFTATEQGVYRSANGGQTWVVNPLIVGSSSGVTLQESNFRSVETRAVDDESTNIWIGSLGGLAKLNEPTNGFWDGEWTVFIASESTDEIVKAFAFPNPFAPDEGKITIQYSTGGKDSDVTIRIFDFGMNLVRTLIQNAPRSGGVKEQQDIWDGRDESGSIVPNGVYFYRIDVGSDEPVYGKIMVLM